MGRSVRDVRLLNAVLARAAGGLSGTLPSLHEARVAMWFEEDGFPVSSDCANAVLEVGEVARDGGATVAGAKPDIVGTELLETYLKLLIPIVALDMPPTMRSTLNALRSVFKIQRSLGAGPFSRANWGIQATISHRDWLLADEHRTRMKDAVRTFFESWDVLIAPVTPTPAFPKNEAGDVISRKLEVEGVKVPYGSNLCWIALATACHLPAAVIPVTRSDAGLPIGVQIIGPQGSDSKVLDVAEALELALGGFRKPPLV